MRDLLDLQNRHMPEDITPHIEGAVSRDIRDQECLQALAEVLEDRDRLGEAEALLRKNARLHPDSPDVWASLGVFAHRRGRGEEAGECYRKALELDSSLAEIAHNLALVLGETGEWREAMALYQRSIEQCPAEPLYRYNLGVFWMSMGNWAAAARSFEEVLELDPSHSKALCNLGVVSVFQGRVRQGVESLERAVGGCPDYDTAVHNRLMALIYIPELSPEELFREHRLWNDRCSAIAKGEPPLPRARAAAVHRGRLRVGYVSPDFRTHSVAYFIVPLLEAHDRDRFHVTAYSDVKHSDCVTGRATAAVDEWRPVSGLDDREVADLIREDGVDVLVDLSGHMSDNRLGVFARRVAPVQVSWLGYPFTTGMDAMDFRIVDAVTDPPGLSEGFASETLVRLPGCFLCYGTPADTPDVRPPPALESGAVTFGSFNHLPKLNEWVVRVWSQILLGVPKSRILIKAQALTDESTVRWYRDLFQRSGVGPERVEFLAWSRGRQGHMETYNRVDVALDPFPYNGTTTSCEALWMGVPVLTMAGYHHPSRVGASLLTAVGMREWIAGSVEEYVSKAVRAAGDVEHLRAARARLRGEMAASPLCDVRRFARRMERAFREMHSRSRNS